MGISADIVLFKRAEKIDCIGDYNDSCENIWRIVNTYGDKPIKEFRELFGSDTEYVRVKTICYIGSGECFHKGILDNYDEDIGLIKLKDSYHLIKEDIWEIIKEALEKHFHVEIEYILAREDLYIDLNY